MNKATNILLVEDSAEDAWMILREFSQQGVRVSCEIVQTADALKEALDRQPWDIVISDYRMPRFSGMVALGVVRVRHPDIPFILLSGGVEEKVANVAVQSGASAYLPKHDLKQLVFTVKREMQKSLHHGI